MSTAKRKIDWFIVTPIMAVIFLGLAMAVPNAGWPLILVAIGLLGSVLSAVHHAEVIAHRVGEPFGTLVLALAVTVIEVALIVSMMLAGGESTNSLPRDTVFAAVMIILNGIVGICLLVGGRRHFEQRFQLKGVSAALAVLASIVILTLVLPNYTSSREGPFYNPSQLIFIAVSTLVLYAAFTLVQTVRHRDYFLPPPEHRADEDLHAEPPTTRATLISFIILLVALVVVVLSTKKISPVFESWLMVAGAPKSVVGIAIAGLVLLPECIAAVRAAAANRLQTSMNLAMGSALASIGLTIPTVAIVALILDWPLALGLDEKSTVLLMLTLFVSVFSLGTGRTTLLHGVVHLVLFATYLFLSIVP